MDPGIRDPGGVRVKEDNSTIKQGTRDKRNICLTKSSCYQTWCHSIGKKEVRLRGNLELELAKPPSICCLDPVLNICKHQGKLATLELNYRSIQAAQVH